MSSLHEFLTMGGYAAYVWPSYAIALVVIGFNVAAPLKRLRRLKSEIRRRGGRA